MHYDSAQTPKLYALCGITHNMDLDLIKGFMVWFLNKLNKVENFVVCSVFTVCLSPFLTTSQKKEAARGSLTGLLYKPKYLMPPIIFSLITFFF